MTARQLHSIVAGEHLHGDEVLVDTNPSDPRDVIAEVHLASRKVAEQAVDAATEAFRTWSRTTPWQRAEILDRAGTEVAARVDDLGDLLAQEEGKTLPEARLEVMRAAQILKYYAGVALQPHGQALDSIRPGVELSVTREPVGVVSVITPWNFPIAIPAWKIAPALAFGNTVVFKPAELVPSLASELVAALHRAGLPPAALNLILGRGANVGPALTSDPRIAALTFTGSVRTGVRIREAAVHAGLKVQLELGGKNPVVITGNADLDIAADVVVQGGYGSTGQRCTASSILIATEDIHDVLVDAVKKRLSKWKVGDARHPDTDMGPVVDPNQMATDLHYIAAAREEGADVFGGQLLDGPGHFLTPALLVGTDPRDSINREEVFGPVVSVISVPNFHSALDAANATTMNLSAGICTRDLAEASTFRRESKAGMVMVNLPTAGVDFHVPFGGRGDSSYGPREQGTAAVEFYTTSKTSYVAPGVVS